MKDKQKLARLVLLLLEIIMVLHCAYSFTSPRLNCIFSYADLKCTDGIVIPFPEDGYYIDSSMDSSGFFAATPGIDLGRGSYRVILQYKTEEGASSYSLDADDATYRLLTGRQNITLNPNKEQESIQFYLNEPTKNFQFRLDFNGSGYLWIKEIQVIQTWQMERMYALFTLIFVLSIEFVWWMKKKQILKRITVQQKNVCLVIGAGIVLASMPCFTYYLNYGFDLNFHLMRIEGIAEGLKNGNFPVKMQLNWLAGNGYPVSVFYGDTLLYIPAILRLIGFPLQSVYKFYIVLVNILTGITMYLAVKGITKDNWIAAVGSFLYLVLPYRLSCIYIRAGVGEYTAMVFMPLVFMGIYQIFRNNVKEKNWKWVWIIPAIGFSGMIQSHLLSCVIIGFFTILVCVCLGKKTIEPARFKMLATVVIATAIANLYFLVPFLDYMQGSYNVNDTAKVSRIETQGAFLNQIFSLFPKGNTISLSVAEGVGVGNEMVLSLGIAAWGGIILFLYWRNNYKKRNNYARVSYLLFGLNLLAVWMSTSAFPWDVLREKFQFAAFLIESLQFPWRVLSVGSVLMIGLISVILNMIASDKREEMKKISAVLVIMSAVSAGFLVSDLVYENNTVYIVDGSDLSSTHLQGAEYVPSGVDVEDLVRARGVISSSEGVYGYECGKGVYRIVMESASDVTQVSVPRLYYKGYQAVSASNGTRMKCFAGENGRVTIEVPNGFVGEINVDFVSPWYWRIAELISLLSVVGLVVGIVLQMKGKLRYAEQSK